MRGNKNAAGTTHQRTPAKEWSIDHCKIRDKINTWCKRVSYKAPVVRSAAYIMFMEASHQDQVRFMKRVRKVLK